EVVVGDEVAGDPAAVVFADDRLDVVGAPPARLPSLDVDDRAEAALEGTSPPGIEGRQAADVAGDGLFREDRHRRPLEVRKLFQKVVERLQAAMQGVFQDVSPA